MDTKHNFNTGDGFDPTNNVKSQLVAWRTAALNTLLLISVMVFTPAIIVWFIQFNPRKDIVNSAVAYFAIYLLTVGLTIFRQIDYRLRAWVLILLTYMTGTQALILGGLAGDGRIYFVVLPIMSLILISARASALISGLVIITYSVLGVSASLGWLESRLIFVDNPVDQSIWLQEGIVMVACIAMVAALQWRFSQFLETIAFKNANLYEHNRKIVAELEQRVTERTSELQIANQNLQEREMMLADAQRIGGVGSWEWDIVNDTKSWSDEAFRIAEISPDQFGGKQADFLNLVHSNDRDMVNRETQAALDGIRPYEVTYCQVMPDQSIKHIHTRAEVIRAEDGTPITMRGITRDITERVQAEEKLRDAIFEIELASNAKSEFLSRMSHELRAPMNLVLGFAQLLDMDQKEPLTATQRKSVGYILTEGEHLLGMIDEVLDIARIETGQLEISPETVDVGAVLSQLESLSRLLAAKNNIQLEFQLPTSEPIFVQADHQRLHQVLLNLISNAIKFNQVGGKVSLTCQFPNPQTVRINIQDTGIGIRPEKIDKLFTPFVRLSESQNDVEGAGLGLAITKHLIELMNGDIGVESIVGQGSNFWIELPIANPPGASLDLIEQNAETPELSLPACSLLYIEDYEANYKLLKDGLAEFPQVQLLWAKDGTSGLEMAIQQPDLILLDLRLPDMQGYEVLKKLKQDDGTHQIPIVVLSADATQRRIDFLIDAGALAYVTKPYKMRQMLRNIQIWLT